MVFNTNCKIILIATTPFGCITQHKQVQLLSRHCTVIKILLFNYKQKTTQGESLSSRTSKQYVGYEQQVMSQPLKEAHGLPPDWSGWICSFSVFRDNSRADFTQIPRTKVTTTIVLMNYLIDTDTVIFR